MECGKTVKRGYPTGSASALGLRLEGLDLEEQKKRGRSTESVPSSLLALVCGLGESLLELGAGVQQQGERRMLGGEGLWDPRRCQQSGKEDVAGDLLQR